ncbi:MAG: glycosyl transferase family 36 [bacterium]|nr:glycosyl transferase family 36 [bacterium]
MSSRTMADRGTTSPEPMHPERIGNRYGHFAAGGKEFCITDPRTPRPWSNIIANPRMGLAVSQTGSGFTWIDNAQLAVITRWEQDFAGDSSGKFLFVRDTQSGAMWSLSPAPTWPAYDDYACRHGIGFSVFRTEAHGIRAEWTLFCHARSTAELWRVSLTNLTDQPRSLEVCAYLEWCCGVAPSPRREFHKLFIETEFDAERRAVVACNHMWEVPSEERGHWNTAFPFVSGLAATAPIQSAEGDQGAFLGRLGSVRSPLALVEQSWAGRFGRHEDPIAAMRSAVLIPPGKTQDLGYVLAVGRTRTALNDVLGRLTSVEAIDSALDEVKSDWERRLASSRIETPDTALDYLANDWLRYQAISGRIWGRCGYYQQSGAYGFRDQLQDSQIWLGIDPAKCAGQIKLHAGHQFADGSVYHWWHPLSEQGLTTRMTDDLLWLAFVTANYIKETGDVGILDETAAFVDDDRPVRLWDHVMRAFDRVSRRMSPRGLPHIGTGDWNDGLSNVGREEQGESVWLGHFLAGLLADWAELAARTGAQAKAQDFLCRREALVKAINAFGWDGAWYIRATLDDGTRLGAAENEFGRIFLNAQTWAVLHDVAPPERAHQCMQSVRDHLVTEVGPLLLTPAFATPDPRVGYITRYAPGLRENGGVYTHAACWAVAAAAKVGDAELVDRLLESLNPVRRNPERYWAEPYVTPGNIDGPESPYFGRGGWTWYTGSAAWLQRVITDWVLGVRAEWDGLRIAPCLPPHWPFASVKRMYRGAEYEVTIRREAGHPTDAGPRVTLNGESLPDNLVPPPSRSPDVQRVDVIIG